MTSLMLAVEASKTHPSKLEMWILSFSFSRAVFSCRLPPHSIHTDFTEYGVELVELLLKNTADVRTENKQGKTALMLASDAYDQNAAGSGECKDRIERALAESKKEEERKATAHAHAHSHANLLAE
jgi:hypothetical protein